jgi:acetyltransferase-like isoleucine patch superfamily enzyme
MNQTMLSQSMNKIHPTAMVSAQAQLGGNVEVGPFSIIHDHVVIGPGSVIGSHCEIGCPAQRPMGQPLILGANSLIRSHSVFYEGSTLGEGLVTGHRVTVREATVAGRNFQIGTLADIQGYCQFGECVRFQSNVFIAQGSRVGSYVWFFPHTVLTNDPHPPSSVMQGVVVEDYVAIATLSVVLPGVRLGKGALVAAHSCVNRDVEPDVVVAGSPAKRICATREIKLKDGTQAAAYPWRRHFHRGYPDDVVAQWLNEFSRAEGESE